MNSIVAVDNSLVKTLSFNKISSYKSLEKLSDILKIKEPALIELMIDTEQEFCPKLKSRMDSNGNFITPELDDMFPFLSSEELAKIRGSI